MCAYAAVHLEDPDRVETLAADALPGVRRVAPGHLAYDKPDGSTIQFELVPIAWPAKIPGDRWSRDAAKATHLIVMAERESTADLIDLFASPALAVKKVRAVEAVARDPRGMCVRGMSGPQAVAGIAIDSARFAFTAPETGGDPFTRDLGLRRSAALDVEIVPSSTLGLDRARVDGWIELGRPLLVDKLVELMGQPRKFVGPMEHLAERGFRYELKGGTIVASIRTDRLTAADVTALGNEVGPDF